jgi:tetratricopeptide (TPR) repeat protein
MPPEGAEIKSQPGTCHVADGRLAAARLAAGRADGVEPLYRAHMDLDAGLALVTGNSLIIQGKPEAAVEPYRQAVLREYGTGAVADHRTGLALTYVAAGDRGTADGLLWRNVELAPRSPFATFPWVDNQVQLGGAAKAVEAARALSVSRPDSVAAHLALHRAAVAAGDEAARTEALMRAGMTVEKLRASEPNAGRTWGLAALVLAAQGKGAEAVDAAKQARTLSPADALSWWASAEAATVAGDAAAAAEFRKRAGIAEPSNAGLLALTKAN